MPRPYTLSEGAVSETARVGTTEATWERLASFSDLKRGVAALHRLERGFATPERPSKDDRLAPWVETTRRRPGLD
jgi:hypothetical protein